MLGPRGDEGSSPSRPQARSRSGLVPQQNNLRRSAGYISCRCSPIIRRLNARSNGGRRTVSSPLRPWRRRVAGGGDDQLRAVRRRRVLVAREDHVRRGRRQRPHDQRHGHADVYTLRQIPQHSARRRAVEVDDVAVDRVGRDRDFGDLCRSFVTFELTIECFLGLRRGVAPVIQRDNTRCHFPLGLRGPRACTTHGLIDLAQLIVLQETDAAGVFAGAGDRASGTTSSSRSRAATTARPWARSA